jgi:predicted nuclease with TOPRIM domain
MSEHALIECAEKYREAAAQRDALAARLAEVEAELKRSRESGAYGRVVAERDKAREALAELEANRAELADQIERLVPGAEVMRDGDRWFVVT